MIATILTLIVALEHLYMMYMEMFAWETRGKRFFRSLPEDLFASTRSMAANQGLYNGFLAAGLGGAFSSETRRGARTSACFSSVAWSWPGRMAR